MNADVSTCWTLVEGAAGGNAADRIRFARIYTPVIRAYLRSRWELSPLMREIEDGIQEVFCDCLRVNGALNRADRHRGKDFRAYLRGVVRNVALRIEKEARRRKERTASVNDLDEHAAGDDDRPSQAFDKALAEAMVGEALELQISRAREMDEAARQRVELLKERIHGESPIREIARRWHEDAARLHHEYARARREFKAALKTTVSSHYGRPEGVTEAEMAELLSLLG